MSSSIDLGTASQKSPSKMGASDTYRPQSSGGSDPSQKKGPGLKEMEKVISGLHKQNFDLKLELYHRRERQGVLEDKVETLEAEKAQVEEANQRMLEEIEQRDKAVEEAVAMIVMLEARMDEMTLQRNMVRHVEAQGIFAPAHDHPQLEIPSPRSKSVDITKLEEDVRVINRMPSFLSDQTEDTENLRNVYLGARGSVLSLPQVPEGFSETNHDTHAGLASPSLSILSESSFLSVYGRKGDEYSAPSRVDEPLSLDGPPSKNNGTERAFDSNGRNGPTPRSSSFSKSHYSGRQFQPLEEVIGPLQRIEKLDPTFAQKRHGLRATSSNKNLGAENTKILRSPGRIATKEERRDELRKVLTDSPGGVSIRDHGLPPTPDTISSTTLRRLQTSNETLSRRRETMDRRSQGSSLDMINVHDIPLDDTDGVPLRSSREPPASDEHPGDSRSHLPYQQAASIQRPRSADETTVSNRREQRWSADSQGSRDSFESNFDIWLREAGSREKPTGGRSSPDLFGFPANPAKGGWAMDAMFGPGNAYSGHPNTSTSSDQMRDLMSAQQALFGATQAPPTPDRQSSIHARTGSGATAKPIKEQSSRRRARHTRRNSDDAQIRAAMKTPAPEQFASEYANQSADSDQKRTNYPPITGHQGAKNGLKRFWRRSIGATPFAPPAEPPVAAAAAEPPTPTRATVDHVHLAQQPAPSTWVTKVAALEDDRTGATPPPILRNPRQRHESAPEVEPSTPATPKMAHAEATTPRTAFPPGMRAPSPVQAQPQPHQQPEQGPAAGTATGSRRKWLPFTRSASAKQKGG